AAAGYLGWKWFSDSRQVGALAELLPEAEKAEFNRLVYASYILMGAAVAGVLGAVLVYMRKGMIAGLLMLAMGIAPGVLAPKAFVFSSVLILAGALAFLVRAKKELPAPAPVRAASAPRPARR